jgi:gamma-glutamylcyclotransferase (GGCT)/AIG2-like uncharacterized protein YtfP
MSFRVFVYGTLLRGEPNHPLLEGARFIQRAHTEPAFLLYDLGHFPALVDGGGQRVAGELYEVGDACLAALDRLEGHPRFYFRSSIVLDSGDVVETYLMPRERLHGRHRLIRCGDWRKRPGAHKETTR